MTSLNPASRSETKKEIMVRVRELQFSSESFIAIFPISKILWGYTALLDTDSEERRLGNWEFLTFSKP